MKDKINIVELLKDCPKGMELNCTTWENVTFEKVVNDLIYVKRNNKDAPFFDKIIVLNKYGCCTDHKDEKCRIFPKDKNTWEGFHRPFKEGDIVSTESGMYIGIVKSTKDSHQCCTFCSIHGKKDFQMGKELFFSRFATKEEKQIMFDAIKANGYHWNPETKTLEKLPRFKVGNRIKEKDSNADVVLITDIADNFYIVETKYGMKVTISISIQDNYELVLDNFDVTTLKPFDKVLVRDNDRQMWAISFFSHCNGLEIYKYSCINGGGYEQCIPYEKNEHLLGTTNDCDNFYKTWEK